MKQQVNLYQGEHRRERPKFSAAGLAATWVALVCVLVLAQSLTNRHVRGVRAELDYTRSREAKVVEQLQQLYATVNPTDGDDTIAIDGAVRQLADKERLLGMLERDEIGATEGFAGHMRALAQRTIDGLWLTRIVVSAPGGKTSLQGEARTPELVPLYLQGLAYEPALAGQRFAQFTIERPEDERGRGRVTFHMTSETSAQFATTGLEP